MQVSTPYYIGPLIKLITLRNFILDNGLTEDDTLLLSAFDFDELALEHRKDYSEPFTVPYLLLGVLIKEDPRGRLRAGEVAIIKNDTESDRIPPGQQEPDRYDGEVIHRCGYCGDVVDFDGMELDAPERNRKIAILEKFGREVEVKHTHGRCCRGKY